MTISIKPTASGSTIEQDGSTILTVDGSGNLTTPNTFTSTGAITGTGGIYLGGTSAANLLDDYEEGTWTPVYHNTSGAMTISYVSSRFGTYRKIGNWVTVNGYIGTDDTTSRTTTSSILSIDGLPFTVANNSGQYYAGCVSYSRRFNKAAGTSNPVSILGRFGSTAIWLYAMDTGTEEIDYRLLDTAIYATTGTYHELYFSLTYLTE